MARRRLRRVLRRVWRKKVTRWHRSALRRARDRADAEDIVQEAVVRVLRAEPNIDSTLATDAYVMQAIRDVAIDRRRTAAAQARLKSRIAAAPLAGPPSPEATVLDREEYEQRLARREAVRAKLVDLRRECRIAIEMYYFDEPPGGLRSQPVALDLDALG